LLCVRESQTSAERQRLASRHRTCCLRRYVPSRRLRLVPFRGSIVHPTQSLCTLRRGRHLPRRNTRYQAGATPYLGRTSTGWNAPASPGAHVTEYKEGRAAISPPSRSAVSGRSRGSTVAWCPPLRWQTRRLEVVRRSLPRNVPSLLVRRVGGLLRLHLLQYRRQPLVVDDRAGLHCLDLVKHLEIERRSVELNREPPVWVIHYLHFLAHQATGQWRRVQQQHHPVVVQGQVARDRALLPPGQDLVEVRLDRRYGRASETGSLETPSSSGESANYRFSEHPMLLAQQRLRWCLPAPRGQGPRRAVGRNPRFDRGEPAALSGDDARHRGHRSG